MMSKDKSHKTVGQKPQEIATSCQVPLDVLSVNTTSGAGLTTVSLFGEDIMVGNKAKVSARWSVWSLATLVFLLRTTLGGAYTKPQVKEYCQFESFNASCAANEVVVIDEAVYGRYKVGRCVTKDYGHALCQKDVRHYLESLCSGKRSCKFEIPDATLKAMKPCPKDFTSYLAASYICMPVQTGGSKSCYSGGSLEVPANPEGYLASTITEQLGKGSIECPWSLRAKPGQKINITLLDFMSSYSHENNDVIVDGTDPRRKMNTYCHKYAVIKEKNRETVVCGGEGRQRQVYISVSNQVDIEIHIYSTPKKNVYFMLQYKAIGCPDYPTPKNGWTQRDGQVTYVGCNDTDRNWQLKCVNTGWVGASQNCTIASGILIVSAMGILLGLVIGAALLAVVLVFVRRNKSTCLGPAGEYIETSQEVEDHTGGNYVIQNKRNSVTALMDQYEMSNIADNYGATWRAHTPTCHQLDHDVTTRFVTPLVTCSASVTDNNGSPCRAPDVTCVVRKGQGRGRGHDSHLYEAPFIGRDIQLHNLAARDG